MSWHLESSVEHDRVRILVLQTRHVPQHVFLGDDAEQTSVVRHERLPQSELAEHLDDRLHGRRVGQRQCAGRAVHETHVAIDRARVHVERDRNRTFRAIWPRKWVADHWLAFIQDMRALRVPGQPDFITAVQIEIRQLALLHLYLEFMALCVL